MKKKTVAVLLLVVVAVLAITGVVLFFLLRPSSSPRFTVIRVDVYQLQAVPASSVPADVVRATCFVQLTLLAINPNKRSRASHGPIGVYAAFGDQNLTTVGTVHGFHQPGDSYDMVIVPLSGWERPVATTAWYQLGEELLAGRVVLTFNGTGSVKWETGPFSSPTHAFRFSCDVVLEYVQLTQSWAMQSSATATTCTYTAR